MEYRLLGNSGLRVSSLSFGTATFGGQDKFLKAFGSTQLAEAKQLIDICIDAGVNLFDTADTYSSGLAEEILGQALAAKRDKVLIATKVHMRTSDDVNDIGGSRHHIIRACEASLRRLRTDYIDLYQLHNIDCLTTLEHSLRALDDLVRSGKVRYIGVSNYTAWQLMKAIAISERQLLEKFVSLQSYYNLVARELEYEFIPLCLSEGLGILVWGPLAGGFLTGKFQKGQTPGVGTRRSQIGDYGCINEERGFAIIDVARNIASARNTSVSQVCLNYLLKKPGVTSLILGARDQNQLKDNLKSAIWDLTDDEFTLLDVASKTASPYPYWHHERTNAERMY